MTLHFKRNLPLVLTLACVLTFLVLVIGSQPIVSYTVSTDALGSVSFTGISNNANSAADLFSIVQP